jgi:hypothetical protein
MDFLLLNEVLLGAQTILPKNICHVDILRINMHIVIESTASKIFTNSPNTQRKEGAESFCFLLHHRLP